MEKAVIGEWFFSLCYFLSWGALKAKWPNYEAHDVSQVFSRLLGNLPEGILTASAWSDWNHARDLTDIKQCLSIIPPLNRIILQKLFSLLKILSSNPDTKMDIKALQIVFGVLMHHQDYTSTSVVMIPNLTDMFTILIEQYDECFPVNEKYFKIFWDLFQILILTITNFPIKFPAS